MAKKQIVLLNAATATVTAPFISLPESVSGFTVQASVVGTGAVTATVQVEVSNDDTYWIVIGTISLSGTTNDTDGIAVSAPWKSVRPNLTAITGTSAAVTVTASV